LFLFISDLPFEEELLRNPHSLKSWLRYIESREDAPAKQMNILYERALRELPGSYKLWYKYLTVKREQVKERPINQSTVVVRPGSVFFGEKNFLGCT
jgi:hypothetical protein